MGVQISLLLPHYLADWSARTALLGTLAKILPEAHSIAEYALAENSQEAPADEDAWTIEPPFPHPYTREYARFSGPGGLFVDINSHAVCVSPIARWRNFLRVQPLRSIHIRAFKSLLIAFGTNTARCFPEDDIVEGAFWEGADFPTCCELLDQRYGPAISLEDAIDPELANSAEHCCPLLQYVMTIS